MTALRCQPVRRDRRPRCPTKLQVLATPDLLKRHQPAAWLTNREIAAAASVFLAANLSGCTKSPPAPSAVKKATLAPDAPAIVAPIFAHGDGRGATGCVVLVPPEFLSEEEAHQVIRDELSRAGLALADENVPLSQVTIPPRYITLEITGSGQGADYVEKIVEAPEEARPLTADFLDPARRIAAVYVSEADYRRLGGPGWGRGCWSSATSYDFCETAAFVSDQVRDKPAGVFFGVFYDPVLSRASVVRWVGQDSTTNANPLAPLLELLSADAERDRLVQAESKALLRAQVKDFVDWLKAQGAI